jgi:anti-sigma B factor antagonist
VAAQPTTEIEIHSPATCIVTLRGEHDASTSEAVTMALTLARGYANVLVDLAGCRFVDSSLINALLLASKRAREHGGVVALVVPTGATAVRRIFEIANVQMVMPFHATRAEGIESIESFGGQRRRSAPLIIPEAGDQAEFVRRRTRARTDVTVLRARVTDTPATTHLGAKVDPEPSHEPVDHEPWAA